MMKDGNVVCVYFPRVGYIQDKLKASLVDVTEFASEKDFAICAAVRRS